MKASVPNDLDYDDDRPLIRLAHQHRLTLKPPSQSNFRVIAILCYETDDCNQPRQDDTRPSIITDDTSLAGLVSTRRQHLVIGTNGEPGGNIGGSICAERSAILQLRFIPHLHRISKLIISTDARQPIAPGMMCREFLSGTPKVPRDLPIVLVGSYCRSCSLDLSFPDNQSFSSSEEALVPLQSSCSCHQHRTPSSDTQDDDGFKFHSFKVLRTTLEQLYPYPSLYAHLTAQDASQLGGHLKTWRSVSTQAPSQTVGSSSSMTNPSSVLMDLATRAARRQHQRDRTDRPDFLHYPITYAAAVLFDDGSMAAACQKKALEYGCTLDAVCQLAHVMDDENDFDDHDETGFSQEDQMPPFRPKRKPVLLVQMDQYGLVHAPFAPARAFLSEHGYGQCRILLQTNMVQTNGATSDHALEYVQVPASDLAPLVPDNSCHS